MRKVFVDVQNRDTRPVAADLGRPRDLAAAPTTSIEGTRSLRGLSPPPTWSLNLTGPGERPDAGPRTYPGEDCRRHERRRPADPTRAVKKIETFSLADAPPTMAYTAPTAVVW